MTQDTKSIEQRLIEELSDKIVAQIDKARFQHQRLTRSSIEMAVYIAVEQHLPTFLTTYGDHRYEEGARNQAMLDADAAAAAREEERERYSELEDWAEGVVKGTAFSAETGLIWKHWLEEGGRILTALTPTKTDKQEDYPAKTTDHV